MIAFRWPFSFQFRFSVHHSEKDKEFYISLEGKNGTRTKAYLKYTKLPKALDLRTTVVPKAFEGKANLKFTTDWVRIARFVNLI